MALTAPGTRIARELKKASLMPVGNVRSYHTTTAYLLGGIPPEENRELPRAEAMQRNIHRDKCDAARDVFNTVIDCTLVESVTYGAGRDSQWVLQYFRNEISTRGENDLMIVYLDAKARGNGRDHVWEVPGNARLIGAHAFLNLFLETEVDVLIYFDGPRPTRYRNRTEVKRNLGNTEYIFAGEHVPNRDNSRHQHGLTEVFRRNLRLFLNMGPRKLCKWKRKTIPELGHRDTELWQNTQRFWSKQPEKDREYIVERIVVEPSHVHATGRILFHMCRIQGPLLPGPQGVPGDLPPGENDGRPPGDDGEVDEADDGSDGGSSDEDDDYDESGARDPRRDMFKDTRTQNDNNKDNPAKSVGQMPATKSVWNRPTGPRYGGGARFGRYERTRTRTRDLPQQSIKKESSPYGFVEGERQRQRSRTYGPEANESVERSPYEQRGKRRRLDPRDDSRYRREDRWASEPRGKFQDVGHKYARNDWGRYEARGEMRDYTHASRRESRPRSGYWDDYRDDYRDDRYGYTREERLRHQTRVDFNNPNYTYSRDYKYDYPDERRRGDATRYDDREYSRRAPRRMPLSTGYGASTWTGAREDEARVRHRHDSSALTETRSRCSWTWRAPAALRRDCDDSHKSFDEKPAPQPVGPRDGSPLFMEE